MDSVLQVDKGKFKVPETSLPEREETLSKKTISKEYFSAKCDYCLAKWARCELQRLEAYLAFNCPNADNELNNQSSLKRYFSQTAEEDLSEERIYSINHLLLKAFTVCGILFSAIKKPIFY
ncbi:25265_t:CDS:2 [Dentiscutata erythropus]|uniref:25265_t:CDS:1 n=1 Tax=Dentiscutata erythropus TaxID=1348616 RepID=A0A9N8ZUI8_9GLOM|nr:25265_t:CDS:2 [Dentiscutata erythropus]